MPVDEAAATLAELGRLEAQVVELRLRALARLDRDEVAAATAAPSTAAWYAAKVHTVLPAAHRDVRLARGLDEHDLTREALAAGRVHVEQAQVVLSAMAALPADLDRDLRDRAERHLLGEAEHHDPKTLRILGRRILEVVAPDVADAHEAALLEREERDAAAGTQLTCWTDAQGRVKGRFTIDGLTRAMFTRALRAFASRKHRAARGPLGEPQPTPQQLGEAFVEMIRRYPAKRLPKSGGLNASVVVLTPLETLMGGLKAAHLDTGEPLSPEAARLLACEARIVPAVLGGASQVLDLGRSRRFHSEAQRLKALIEHRGCAVDGCERLGLHMHHPTRWADGGETNSDGVPLCPWHHHRIHDNRYEFSQQPSGKVTFHRRT